MLIKKVILILHKKMAPLIIKIFRLCSKYKLDYKLDDTRLNIDINLDLFYAISRVNLEIV